MLLLHIPTVGLDVGPLSCTVILLEVSFLGWGIELTLRSLRENKTVHLYTDLACVNPTVPRISTSSSHMLASAVGGVASVFGVLQRRISANFALLQRVRMRVHLSNKCFAS